MLLEAQQSTRVIVTGGCGFLGGHIVQQLLKNPAMRVIVISRKAKAVSSNSDLSYHEADITSEAQIKAIFDKFKPNVIIHTASPRPTDQASVLAKIGYARTLA